MDFLEKELEMRGMKRREIVNYFSTLTGKVIGDDLFVGKGWEVYISQEKLLAIGSLNIPSTIVKFRCTKGIMDKMIGDFRLKFLTAGG